MIEPVIKSKEKCLHCIYGTTGECVMYDDFGLPDDGDKCYNFIEADEEEMANGFRIANGDITIDDCVGWLNEQASDLAPDSPTAKLYKQSAAHLRYLQRQHGEDRMWMDETQASINFWQKFTEYLVDRAIGDKWPLIETVQGNEHNWFEGYVEVEKRIDERQRLLLTFTTSKGEKHTAEWQASDNYAVWQTCGIVGDDYSGYLLMPTDKDNEYFCIYYMC